MSKKPRLSPWATVMIERKDAQGQIDLTVEYHASSLKGGQAFARAIQKAQQDQTARAVVYMEHRMGETKAYARVPMHENEETPVSPEFTIPEGELPF